MVDGVDQKAALDDPHPSQEVQQVRHVVWQEAEQRYGQDGVNDLHGLLGGFSPYPGDALRRQRVAHQDDDGWHQGAQDQAQQAVPQQAAVPLLLGEILEAAVASGCVRVGVQGPHEDEDQHGHRHHAPEHNAHDQGAAVAPHFQMAVRVYCGHVAVHADTSHEEDAQVDVGEEQGAGDVAGDIPEHPVVTVEVVVDP